MDLTLLMLRPETFAFKSVVFDFDGTLADSLDVWAKVDSIFFSRRGLDYGPNFAEKLSLLGFEDGARYTIDHYGLSDSVEEVCNEWNSLGCELYATEVDFYPGALDYLQRLRDAGIPYAIATTNRPEVLLSMEPRYPISELFPIRVHGCDVPRGTKKDPDIYAEALQQLGAPPSESVLFEDLPMGISTARGIGLPCVGFLSSNDPTRRSSLAKVSNLTLDSWNSLFD